LPHLLRFFRLPPDATSAQLRQAYLARVKQVHPDLCKDASRDQFQELQAHFEEALDLLNPKNKWKRKSPSAPQAHTWDQRSEAQFWHSTAKPSAVPTTGMSGATVYPFAAALAVAGGASIYFSQRQAPAPTVAEVPRAPARRAPQPEQREEKKAQWPPLTPGPWSVHACKVAEQEAKGVWAPSKAWEMQNKESFYSSRAQGHLRANIGQRKRLGEEQGKQVKVQGYEASHNPVARDGVQMLPVHLAAEDGHVWWLEECGASVQCRGTMDTGDTREETPLHHAARYGQEQACIALLRLGANPSVKSSDGQLPEEVAAAAGNSKLAALLQEARDSPGLWEASLQHPDGIGVLHEPPASVIFTGLNQSGVMRRAVNMAAGCSVAPPLPMTRAMHDAQADRLVNIARGSLQGTEFDLEDLVPSCLSAIQATAEADAAWEAAGRSGVDLQGLLIYEPPGSVTEDAPGHWVAVRRVPAPDEGFFRLDPVRGPFRLSDQDLKDMLGRYRAWRVTQAGRETRMARTAQLGAARQETLAAVQARQNGI